MSEKIWCVWKKKTSKELNKEKRIKTSNFKLEGFNSSFEKWHKKNLIEFLNFIYFNHIEEMKKYLNEYYEVLSGN